MSGYGRILSLLARSGKDECQNREHGQDEYESQPVEKHDATGDKARQARGERSQSICGRMAARIHRRYDQAANEDQCAERQCHGREGQQKPKRRKVVHQLVHPECLRRSDLAECGLCLNGLEVASRSRARTQLAH